MLVCIFLIVWITNIILSFLQKKSKIVNFLTIVFLFVLFCGNTLNGDYWAYKWRYDAGEFNTFEIGYRTIATFCRNQGLSYNAFITVLVVPLYILLIYHIKKTGINLSIFFSLYFSILVFYDINQVRNFVVVVILTVSMLFLMQGKKAIFIMGIAFSALFHSIAIVYFILLFIDEKKILKEKYYYLIIFIISSICITLKVYGESLPIISWIISPMSENQGSVVYGETIMGIGFIIPFICYFANLFLVIYSKKIIVKNNRYEENKLLVDMCYKAIIASAFFLPLTILNLTFDRIFRNFNFIVYILVGITISCFNKQNLRHTSKTKIKYWGALVIYCIIWSFGTVMRYNGFNQLEWDLILHNNIFFN